MMRLFKITVFSSALLFVSPGLYAACIDEDGDTDDYSYETLANDPVSIAVLGQAYGLDPVLEIYDPDGNLIAVNDDAGINGPRIAGVSMGGLDSAILNFRPDVNGIHNVVVRGFGSSTGCYLIVFRSEQSPQAARTLSGDDGGVNAPLLPEEMLPK